MAQQSLPPFSETVKLAWRLAAEEAVHAGRPQIELPHLLLGVCGVERVIREEAWERYAVSPSRSGSVRQEWNEVSSAATLAGLDAIHLRREVRSRLPQNSIALPANHVAKRSDFTRAVFDQAEQRAAMVEHALVSLFDLLGCLLAAMVEKDPIIPAHFGAPLQKLQTLMAPPPVSGVTLLLDATRTSVQEPLEHLKTTPREALFYDLPLQMASQANYQATLDCAVSSLLKFFPAASHAVMLLKDRGSNCLLLQAHVPAGEPSASMELAEHVLKQNSAVIWNPAAAAENDIGARSLIGMQTTCAMYAPLSWQNERLGALCVDTRKAGSTFTPDDLRLFIAISHHVALSIYSQRLTRDLQTQNQLLQRLLTHFSPKVRQRLLERAGRGRLTLGGERSEVSILFSDIRGFTRMSATMEPDDVLDMLNAYFAALVEAIFRCEGTVDKFIGDAILAVFGSPDPDPEHHRQALHAALAMQEAVQKLNAARKERNQPTCEIGIGVHSGDVLHGFVGTQERLEFTVVGDAVNRASRFCAAAGANEIIVSSEFLKHVWREVEVESRDVPTKHEGTWAAFRVLKTKLPH
ncbi:MAG TPA: adenylate/guanylate cyclase domain-containing protein [Candidatus Acidoferrales bacterium]|jgi:adenylate cyclase|nr:adenylate/guanylate cyclase domain-containing protein [Candidatus Acidoferrales bacterium]